MNSLELSTLDYGRRIVELYGDRIAKASGKCSAKVFMEY
jgi:hypothetical protein